MPRYTIRVSKGTINRFNTEIDAFEGKVKELSSELAGRLAKHCAELAQDEFDAARDSYPGVYDVTVKARQTKKGNWSVTASGNSVKFIEFGTGTHGDGDWASRWYFTIKPGTPKAGNRVEEEPYYKHAVSSYERNAREESYVDEVTGETVKGEIIEKKDKDGNYYKVKETVYVEKENSGVTTGNLPMRCLQTAYEYMVEDFPEYSEEVFG